MGAEFPDNAIEIDAVREDVTLTGFAGVPTFNRGNSAHQYAFVNGRPVQDKLILSAIRGAYAETMPSGRYPGRGAVADARSGAGRRQCPSGEVRRALPRSRLVRGLIVGAIREALGARRQTGRRQRAPATCFAPSAPASSRAGAPRPHPPTWTAEASPSRPYAVAPRRQRRVRANAPQAAFDGVVHSYRARRRRTATREAPPPRRAAGTLSAGRRTRAECTRTISSRRPRTASSSSTSTPRMSGWSSRRCARRCTRSGMPSQVLLIPEIVDLPEEDATG